MFVLIPGAGGSSWYWHRLAPLLVDQGHRVVTPELPATDPTARLTDYVEAVTELVKPTSDLAIVGQSLGGLVAPIVADRLGARLLVMLVAMIPAPGESGGQWWNNTGQPDAATTAARAEGRDPDKLNDPIDTFLHDLPPDVRAEAMRRPVEQNDGPFRDPWPLTAWPGVPTRVVAARHDRLFPLAFMQRVARARLGLEPDIIDTGHLPALAKPDALAELLTAYLGPTRSAPQPSSQGATRRATGPRTPGRSAGTRLPSSGEP